MRLKPVVCLAAVVPLVLSACSSGNTEDSDQAFCEAMDGLWDSSVDINVGMDDIFMLLENEGASSDPDVIGALHDSAELVLESAAEARGFADTATKNIRSDEVKEAFETYNAIGIDLAILIAEAALSSEDLVDFLAALMELSPQLEEAGNLDFDELDAIVRDYGREVCEDSSEPFADQDQRYYDTNAKVDVATLGKEISVYYVDNVEPDPTITVRDGKYYLLDTYIWEVSEGNRITDQVYDSPIDWCVEVTNDQGSLKTFFYSSAEGLNAGTCS